MAHAHVAGKLVLAGGGRPQFLCTLAFPEDRLGVLTTWQLVSSGASYPRGQGRSFNVLSDLPSAITYHPFSTTVLTTWVSSGSLCEGTTRGYGLQEARPSGTVFEAGHQGLSLRLATKQSDRFEVRAQ